MGPAPDPGRFAVHQAEVRHGLHLAYLHEGVGGYPLVLLHGYPETKRIWWRNVAELAEAGYEVIVPDLRGHGDSDLDPEDRYDIVTYSRDIEVLVRDILGHERFGVVAGDVGAVVAYDLALRVPGLVDALVWFNTAPPFLPEAYAAAGIRLGSFGDPATRPETDYQARQGGEPDLLAAELDTPAPPPLHRRLLRPPAVGRPGGVRTGRRGLHDRAVGRRGPAAGGLGGVPAGDRQPVSG